MVANKLKQLGLLDGSGKSVRHALLIACCFLIIAVIEARAGETAAVVLKVDGGYHPMTVYLPLVVHGALLVEPTESESRDSLDRFIAALAGLGEAAE